MKKEPAITVGTITALVAAIISLLAAFGLHLTTDQKGAILSVVAVVAPIVSAFITRSKVTPATSAKHAR